MIRTIFAYLKELYTVDPICPGILLVLLVPLSLLMQVLLLLLVEALLLLKRSEHLLTSQKLGISLGSSLLLQLFILLINLSAE